MCACVFIVYNNSFEDGKEKSSLVVWLLFVRWRWWKREDTENKEKERKRGRERDKNRYKSSQLLGILTRSRYGAQNSAVLVFLKFFRWNEHAFWATRCRYNEWTLFCQSIPDFPHKNTNANTKNSSRLKSPARRYVCDALLLERFRCVAFFLGAPFSSSARFFLCARFLFANKTSNLLTEMFRSSS